MKTLLTAIAAAVLLTGCTTVVTPQGECRRTFRLKSDHSVVNNTVYKLDVVQDGQMIMRDLAPGQILPIPPRLFDGRSMVVVTAHTDDNRHVGVATRLFLWDVPDAWVLTYLEGYAR